MIFRPVACEQLSLQALSLVSPTAPGGSVSINLQQSKEQLAQIKQNPISVKEGVEYSVKIRFSVGSDILSGLKYVQVVKRAGIKVDKMEEMIGSYGPRPEPYEKTFASSEAPSGMMARGTYSVRSRVVDDDGNVFADWDWAFKVSSSFSETMPKWQSTDDNPPASCLASSVDCKGLVILQASAQSCLLPPILFVPSTQSSPSRNLSNANLSVTIEPC